MHTIELRTKLINEHSQQYQTLSNLIKSSSSGPLIQSFARYDRPAPITLIERSRTAPLFNGQISFMGSVFYLRVDCLELLQKPNIETDADIAFIKMKINSFLLNTGLCVDDLILTDVDYCCNICIENAAIRSLLISLYNQMPEQSDYMSRSGYHKRGLYTYSASFYYQNHSRCTQFYDKEAEVKTKGYKLRSYEKNIMRFECQLRRNALKNLSRRFGAPPTFDFWVNLDVEAFFIRKACRLLPQSDFWSMSEATRIIDNSNYTKSMRNKLKQYLFDVATVGSMDKVSSINARSQQTINTYIYRLSTLNINPITLKKTLNMGYLSNPLKW